MESAFIFGQVGNLTGCLGTGWSVEDTYAWAVGYESFLTLPLPADDQSYRAHFTVHGLTNPGVRDAQRLIVKAGDVALGKFAVSERTTVELTLPPELTAGQEQIVLTLLHPDALRPSDFLDSTDTRPLTICFHSAGLIQDLPEAASEAEADLPVGIVAGNFNALQLARIASALPSLRGKFKIQYTDTHPHLEETAHTRSADAVSSAAFCWLQLCTGRASTTQALRAALPAGCPVQRFGIPEMHAFWPFLGADPRAVREPDRYVPARYRFGDRIAMSLPNHTMADDLLFMIYEGLAEKEMPDLNALLAVDIMSWKRLDSRCDVKIASALEAMVRRDRPFKAPTIPGLPLLRILTERLLDTPAIRAVVSHADLLLELDELMRGYVGRREELPLDPRVARHFQLSWWTENQTYRWFGNRLGFKDYMLDYMRWAAWRP